MLLQWAISACVRRRVCVYVSGAWSCTTITSNNKKQLQQQAQFDTNLIIKTNCNRQSSSSSRAGQHSRSTCDAFQGFEFQNIFLPCSCHTHTVHSQSDTLKLVFISHVVRKTNVSTKCVFAHAPLYTKMQTL